MSTLLSFVSTRVTVPVFPLSFPEITMTVSLVWIFIKIELGGNVRIQYAHLWIFDYLYNFWSERNNFLIPTSFQFSKNRTKNASAFWLKFIIDNHTCIVIRANVRTILTTDFFCGTNDYSFTDSFLLNISVWKSFFYRYYDNITNACITTFWSFENFDTERFFRSSIIDNDKS